MRSPLQDRQGKIRESQKDDQETAFLRASGYNLLEVQGGKGRAGLDRRLRRCRGWGARRIMNYE